MKRIALFFLMACFLPVVHADSGMSVGLCATPETAWFVCRTARNSWISLCGTAPAHFQYRYGTPEKIELRYPQRPDARRFRYATYARFQSSRTEVTFFNRGHQYTLFDYREAQNRHAGIRVTAPRGQEHEILCSSQLASRLPALQGVLPCDQAHALNGGICP